MGRSPVMVCKILVDSMALQGISQKATLRNWWECLRIPDLSAKVNFQRTPFKTPLSTLGAALKFLGPDNDVPWQRVVSSTGQISSRGAGTDGAERQRLELEGEGVQVVNMRVSWTEYGWFPENADLNVQTWFLCAFACKCIYESRLILEKALAFVALAFL